MTFDALKFWKVLSGSRARGEHVLHIRKAAHALEANLSVASKLAPSLLATYTRPTKKWMLLQKKYCGKVWIF